MIFSRADGGDQTLHYIEWAEFRKRDEYGSRYVRDDFAGPLLIEGRASISKLVWFRWRTGAHNFTQGKYHLELVVWKENETRPMIREKHEFFIDASEAVDLAEHKASGKTTIEWIGIDKQIESNKRVTAHALEKLLG